VEPRVPQRLQRQPDSADGDGALNAEERPQDGDGREREHRRQAGGRRSEVPSLHITSTRVKLLDYSLSVVSQSKDALGGVMMKVDIGDGELLADRGASTEIIEARARAYLNAANFHLNNGDGRKRKR